MPTEDWDNLNETQHLARITGWCTEKKFECVTVSLGTSKKNPTPWFIEMVVMPNLQHTYLYENMRQLGGSRWQDVPKQFGYVPLDKPFVSAPHPYA